MIAWTLLSVVSEMLVAAPRAPTPTMPTLTSGGASPGSSFMDCSSRCIAPVLIPKGTLLSMVAVAIERRNDAPATRERAAALRDADCMALVESASVWGAAQCGGSEQSRIDAVSWVTEFGGALNLQLASSRNDASSGAAGLRKRGRNGAGLARDMHAWSSRRTLSRRRQTQPQRQQRRRLRPRPRRWPLLP